MLGIMGQEFGPPDIGSLIPKRLIEEAGGLENFRTCECGGGLKVHRRIDDERVRRPVNGRRGFETVRLTSTKNDARDVHCESKGEFPLYCLLEMHASIELYRDQLDVVEIYDEVGRTWACPDAFAVLRRYQQPIWIEGKYATRLVRGPNNRKEVEHGIDPKLESKLARLQRAFSRVGLSYVALNQSFCRSKTVADNVKSGLLATRKSSYAQRDRGAQGIARVRSVAGPQLPGSVLRSRVPGRLALRGDRPRVRRI